MPIAKEIKHKHLFTLCTSTYFVFGAFSSAAIVDVALTIITMKVTLLSALLIASASADAGTCTKVFPTMRHDISWLTVLGRMSQSSWTVQLLSSKMAARTRERLFLIPTIYFDPFRDDCDCDWGAIDRDIEGYRDSGPGDG